MHAADNLFGKKASGSPFSIYVPGCFVSENGESEKMRNWQYAVSVGDTLTDGWNINAFEANRYHLRAYGPNGFYREFKGDKDDPSITIRGLYERSSNHNLQELTGNLSLSFDIADAKQLVVEITDSGYNTNTFKQKISSAQNVIAIKLEKSFGWYDFKIKIDGFPNFERHYAGRVETGRIGYTDPIIGRV